MEQKLAAGLSKGQIAKLIQDQEVEAGDQIGGSALSLRAGFGIQFIHQVDDIEEPSAPAIPDAGAGDTDGEVGFAGACAADQHKVALVIEEVSGGQITDQSLIDLGRFEAELLQFLGQGELGDYPEFCALAW